MKTGKLLSTALTAGMLGAVGFVALPDAAFAQAAITTNQWYTGHFTETGSPIFGDPFGTAYTDDANVAVAELRRRAQSS